MKHIRLEKKGLRGLAIAESFRETNVTSKLAGVIMRRDFVVDGFIFGHATIGGDDSTESILAMYDKLNRQDISFMLISGLIISMYNIVDIKRLSKECKMPVIGVTYEESNGLEDAIMHHFPNTYETKIKQYQNLGARIEVRLHTGYDLYLRVEGCETNEAKRLLDAFTLQGSMPEPLRVAQLLARTELDLTG